ncbi:MAG: glycogen-binding domain-containing protein [Candidatus Krumholzibacteria bacterium]|nr:glycogen-binding domain-containing protein [Candidatus Krumholzibacteria bacterium]
MTRARVIIAVAVAAAAGWGCGSLAPRERSAGPAVADGGVRFHLYAPEASRVQLAGSWPENNWARGDGSAGEADIGLMDDPSGDGNWEIVVPLEPGRYQYLFWLDEHTWRIDPGNAEEVPGGPAGRASLLVVVVRDGKTEVR